MFDCRRSYGVALALLTLVVGNALVNCSLNQLPRPKLEISEGEAYRKLLGIEKVLQNAVGKGIKYAMPFMLSLAREVDLSDECLASLLKVLNSVKDLRLWTFKMFDSIGRPEGGLLQGTMSALGEYDQCLSIKEPVNEYNKNNQIQGQYCLISIRPPLPPKPRHVKVFDQVFRTFNATFKTELMDAFAKNLFGFYDASIRWGVCIPSKCSSTDLSKVLSFVASPLNISTEVTNCDIKEPPMIDTVQLIVMFIFGGIILLNTVGTIATFLSKTDAKKGASLIESFSVKRNFLKAVNNKRGTAQLDFLNGLRFLSMSWVILGHCYFMAEKALLRNPLNIDSFRKDILFEPGSNTYLSVDSFIFIGGAVMSYCMIQKFKEVRVHPIFVVFCRIIRILPCLLVTIGFAILLPLIGSGPFWKSYTEEIASKCRENWWANTLLINNFFKFDDMCLIHSWYIPVDFQCFLLGLVFLTLFRKREIFGKLFLLALVFVSVLSTGLVTYFFKFPPTIILGTLLLTDYKFGTEYMRLSYTATHVHVSVYAIGLFTGVLIAKNPNYKMPVWTALLGWITAAISGLATVYGTHEWNTGTPYGEAESVIYSALYRTVWASCLAWICLACYFGRGGIVNYILSFTAYKPLCRISYLTYLLQYFFVYGYVASRRGPIDYTHSTMIYYFFGVLCLSSMAAFGLHILVENPIGELANFVLLRLKNKRAQNLKNNPQVFQNGNIASRETKVPVDERKDENNFKGEISRL